MRLNPYRSFAGATIVASTLALFPAAIASGQQTATAQPDIYANFVGVWVGTDKYLKDGVEVTEPLRLTIEETKKKDALKFLYEYGTKGQKDYSQPKRRITLNPSIPEMTSKWEGTEIEHYKVIALDSFAQKGFGLFRAVFTEPVNGKNIAYIVTFDLEEETFRYLVQTSEDGQTSVLTKRFVLQRQPQPIRSAPLQTP